MRRTADRLIVHAAARAATRPSSSAGARASSRPAPSATRSGATSSASCDRSIPARLPSASPLRRPAARANATCSARSSTRLGDERPVAARGILLARRASCATPASPLYSERGRASASRPRCGASSGRSSRDARSSPRRDASGGSSSAARCRRASSRRRCSRRRSRSRSSRPTRSRPSPTRPSRRSSCCSPSRRPPAISSFRSRSRSRLLLAIVVVSYMQTVRAYETSGGAYIVARENLGTLPSLVGGAALLTDYVLTVAVSISAGDLRDHVVRPVARRPQGRALARLPAPDRARQPARRARVGARASRCRRISSSPRSACSSSPGSSSSRRVTRTARSCRNALPGRHRRDHALRAAARVLVRLDGADRRRGDRKRRQRIPPAARQERGEDARRSLGVDRDLALPRRLVPRGAPARASERDRLRRLADRAAPCFPRDRRRASCTTPSRA